MTENTPDKVSQSCFRMSNIVWIIAIVGEVLIVAFCLFAVLFNLGAVSRAGLAGSSFSTFLWLIVFTVINFLAAFIASTLWRVLGSWTESFGRMADQRGQNTQSIMHNPVSPVAPVRPTTSPAPPIVAPVTTEAESGINQVVDFQAMVMENQPTVAEPEPIIFTAEDAIQDEETLVPVQEVAERILPEQTTQVHIPEPAQNPAHSAATEALRSAIQQRATPIVASDTLPQTQHVFVERPLVELPPLDKKKEHLVSETVPASDDMRARIQEQQAQRLARLNAQQTQANNK